MMLDILIILLAIAVCVSIGFVAGWICRSESERDKRRRGSRHLPNDYGHRRYRL